MIEFVTKMSSEMLDFRSLPITPEQARAARKFCGFTQDRAAFEASLPSYKIKLFEKGNTIPDTAFLEALRAFYESKGYQFPDVETPGANALSSGAVFPAGVVQPDDDGLATANVGKVQTSQVLHIRIDPSLSADEVGRTLDHIERNEKTVEGLLNQKIDKTQVLGLSGASEAIHGTVVRLLAENGTLLAKLFGRPLIAPKPLGQLTRTHADLLAKTQAAMFGAIAGDRKALAAIATPKSPSGLKAAIFD